ncbi:uncharacterized protein BXZ73DRAFT_91128 [Epithele typhae]|uniref:uncharacterized protein n=1 Tax=Epithele typhae TaxID=378194 RepID=UPI0020078A15|nr:uncharacterized protein BXZ73DRAFT_91128 [Epithele typhae]KAH9925420.1 hypothetical protein BXZ73DRAFT_91128 [Epithele typhae]
MAALDPGTQPAPVAITEDEAAVYDRQIRLWGLEAQQRMRNATILMVCLKGVATEAVKNIVLAGIGKLVVVDAAAVAAEDLGAGFFFRDADVGQKRVDAARSRIESLNPLVAVETISDASVLENDALPSLLARVDMVCATEMTRDNLIALNDACRAAGKPFYAGGTYGLAGYIFCDLLQHEYIAPDRAAPKDAGKSVRLSVAYPPLRAALQHRWTGLTRRQTKEVNPALMFAVLAIWEYQARHGGALPDDAAAATELEATANALMAAAEVNKQAVAAVRPSSSLATTAAHELSPVCAVVGGLLAQDVLKALAAREPPIANFFALTARSAGAPSCAWRCREKRSASRNESPHGAGGWG